MFYSIKIEILNIIITIFTTFAFLFGPLRVFFLTSLQFENFSTSCTYFHALVA